MQPFFSCPRVPSALESWKMGYALQEKSGSLAQIPLFSGLSTEVKIVVIPGGSDDENQSPSVNWTFLFCLQSL